MQVATVAVVVAEAVATSMMVLLVLMTMLAQESSVLKSSTIVLMYSTIDSVKCCCFLNRVHFSWVHVFLVAVLLRHTRDNTICHVAL